VSFVGTDDLIQEAGSDAEGVVVTQVAYYSAEYKNVALYRRTLAKCYPSAQPNSASREGFVDAMVLVEGLKKAGERVDTGRIDSGDRIPPGFGFRPRLWRTQRGLSGSIYRLAASAWSKAW